MIFRATPQWFAAMDKPITNDPNDTLRERAMRAIARDEMVSAARARTASAGMVKDRPDWVLSRQRAWGVPLAIFVDKKTQEVLNDPAVNARIVDAFKAEGADAWFNSPPSRFLGNGRNPDDYEQVKDILDVWFDSGSTHVFTVEAADRAVLAEERITPISISKAPTSIAAGSSPRCWKAAARAAARPTTKC